MSGWEMKNLADVATTFGRGKSRHRPRNDESLYGGKYPFIQTGEIRNADHFLTSFSKTYNEKGLAQSKLWPVGTLCITIAANIAETAILTFEACIPDSVIGLVVDPDKADVRFVEYLLQSFKSGLQAEGKGSAQDNINMGTFERMSFPFPEVAEQKRIVSILDEAFSAIAKAKENAEKNLLGARELFESYLNRVFTQLWQDCELVTMSDIATDITDGDHNAPPKSETGIPFITISNINKSTRKVDFSNTFKVPREYFDGLKPNRKPRRDDVLYTVTGSFGIPVLVDHDDEFCFQRHIGLIRPKEDVDSTWLYYLCLTPQIFIQAERRATGTAQKTVSLKVLRSIEVPKVGLPEQQEMLPALEQVANKAKQLETIYTQKLANLDELKQSLLQKAFTGQLSGDEVAV